MKKISIIGTNGLPGNYGGWDQLVYHLTLLLNDQFDFIVYSSSHNKENIYKKFNGAKIRTLKFKANGIQSIPYDFFSMLDSIFKSKIYFICGTSGAFAIPLFRLLGKKIILNPDGKEWERGKWSFFIRKYLKFSELIGVKFSHSIIADNIKMQEYFKAYYNKSSTLIEYGGDHVLFKNLTKFVSDKYKIISKSYVFKVCRIVPENNISLILETFSTFPSVKLVIIGNWNNSEYGTSLKKKYSCFKNILILDPIYNQVELDEIRGNCGLYIHGHSVGGTNPSLVEAMSLGLTIAAYNVGYNLETTNHKALYFSNSIDLKDILINFSNGKFSNNEIGIQMKEIAELRYKWLNISQKYSLLFKKYY
jgi:glycosyltransferase involved in cell wall biosynthesis